MGIAYVILGLYVTGFIAALIIIVYLIFRRIRKRREETFEKRDN